MNNSEIREIAALLIQDSLLCVKALSVALRTVLSLYDDAGVGPADMARLQATANELEGIATDLAALADVAPRMDLEQLLTEGQQIDKRISECAEHTGQLLEAVRPDEAEYTMFAILYSAN